MVRNVSNPTYFWSGHVLNSKLVSETCKQFCFCCKIDPKHDQKIHRTQFYTLLKSYIRITHTCTRESAVHTEKKIPINHTISVPDIKLKDKGLANS